MSIDINRLLNSAETGDVDAMNKLAWIYGQGEGVPRDRAKCHYWAKRSAELQDPEGLYNHGVHHANGELGRTDIDMANRLWRQAAAKGHPPAMANIGLSYFHGNGVPRDLTMALEWMKKCALADEPKGMVTVAQMYFFGHGTPIDLIESLAWLLLAAGRAPQADEGIALLSGRLTPLQKAQAKSRADELRREIIPL
jgi:TPR repeat protein